MKIPKSRSLGLVINHLKKARQKVESLGQKLQFLNKLFCKFIGIIQFQMSLEELRKGAKLVEK